jgi:NADH dehydrogenase
MNLVAGATGHAGGEVCRLLKEQGEPVRALVRSSSAPERVAVLRALGVELALGDLRDPKSLERACAGVTAVISTASATSAHKPGDTVINVDGDGQMALVDAARKMGARHFVFVSFSGGIEIDTPIRTSKRAVEQYVRDSGMSWTILRPTAFMEAWLSPALGFDAPNGRVTVFGDGEQAISYISLYDVARFCVAVLPNPEGRNATLELGGPAAVTPNEAVRIAERIAGRPMAVQHVPLDALRAQYEAATDTLEKSFAGLTFALAQGDVVDMEDVLAAFPLRLRTVDMHLAELLSESVSVPV